MLKTLGDRWEEQGGVPAGFDAVRIVLALLVVLFHSFVVTGQGSLLPPQAWLLGDALVPAFFVLSGFLVTASAHRRRVGEFLVNRALRIVPPLVVTVAVSALAIGPLWTTLPLREYFASPAFARYFLNIVGKAYPGLPGVWQGHPSTAVNASLWSIRWEVGCYLLLAALAATGAMRRRRAMLALCGAGVLAPPLLFAGARAAGVPSGESWLLALLTGWYFRVVPFFLAGSAAFLLRRGLPASPMVGWACALALALVSMLVPPVWNNPLTDLAICAPLTLLVLTAGVSSRRVVRPFDRGDYSYGIYLYAFPVQQIVTRSGWDRGAWQLNALITLPLVTAMAMVSWHAFERPILLRRTEIARRFSLRRPTPVQLAQEAPSAP